MADAVENAIIAYLEDAKPPGTGVDRVDRDTNLIATGVIDSFGIVGMIEFLEDEYAIVVADDDVDPEIFRTVDTIAAYVLATRQPAR